MKKTKLILASASLLLVAALAARAQTETTPAVATTTDSSSYRAADDFGARSGDWEFTLGGGGSSNQDMDNSLGGVNFSVGHFFSDTFELSVRQSVNYTNGSGGAGGANYDASTFVAVDQHFGTGRLRPFLGLNVGYLYGDTTNNTFAAGIEGGLKFYVQPKTFLFALVNYAWTFDHASDADENFGDGAFLWTVGVGFNL